MLGSQPTATREVTIAPGETLVFYTDGVVEAQDAQDAEFGTSGLMRVLSNSAALPAERTIHAVVDATRAHAGTDHYSDDFTILVVKRDVSR
jgi:serine phosphatase RsbU (regulator of sigma subunit)